ncbi:MAG: Peptidoglycan-binding LysM [Paenibacillaceae bacterium]|jgi:hypothetical protein|nr:Peptidoglycan-binding LysM [Paenibacillaceae bacterium]
MSFSYGLWLSFNNQEDVFEFPILPGKIEVSNQGEGSGYEVYGLGQINVIKSPGLAEYSFETILPATQNQYPFITARYYYEPRYYVELIEKWRQTRHPIRFVYTGPSLQINTPASIESLDWSETAGENGDIQISLKLKEYRFYAARRTFVKDGEVQQSEPLRADYRGFQPFYVVKEEKETLSTISQQIYGTPDYQVSIKELNKLSDAEAENLLPGKILQLPNEFLLKKVKGAAT